MEKLLIYTDGSAKSKKKGSYAFAVINPDTLDVIYHEATSIGSPLTNIFFELLSLVKAMDYIATHHPDSFSVFVTDCSSNIECFERVQQEDTTMFRNQICNQLASKMHKILSQDEMKHTTVEKVKGHSGDYFNHLVDRLCWGVRKNKNISIEDLMSNAKEKHLRSIYQEKTGYKIKEWFKNAKLGVNFSYKPKRFDKKYNYIGQGEVKAYSFSEEYITKLENYAKENKVYMVEKEGKRLRLYKNKFVDIFPNHPLFPVMGKYFTLFNGNMDIAKKYADCTINDDYLIKLAKKPESFEDPLPEQPIEPAHKIQQKKIKKKV